jgi:general secretion pathway protein B
MSYILEALRKADRERTLGEVPDLEAAHWGVRRPDRSRRWLWVVAALLVFNGGLLVYMLNRKPDAGITPPRHTAQRDVTVSPARPPAPPVSRPVPAAPVAAPPAPAPRILRPRVAVQPHVEPHPATAAKPLQPAGRVVTSTEPLTASSDSTGSGLPEWSQLPLEFRSQFVVPHIDVYVYDDDPQRRFILVDLKKFREGDTLPDGAVLEKIQSGYIELNYRGTRFRLDR